MSISRLRRGRGRTPRPARASARRATASGGLCRCRRPCPARAARAAASDRRFRTLVNDLFTIASRMEIVRAHLGRAHGHQRTAIQRADRGRASAGRAPASASARWRRRCTCRAPSSPRRPARWRAAACCSSGRIREDRRGVLLSLAPAGRLKIDRIGAEIRAINDLFFGALDAARCLRSALCVGERSAGAEFERRVMTRHDAALVAGCVDSSPAKRPSQSFMRSWFATWRPIRVRFRAADRRCVRDLQQSARSVTQLVKKQHS